MADRDPYNPEDVSPDQSAGTAAGSVLVREAADADRRAAEAIDGPGSHIPEPGASWIVAEEAGTGRVLGYATPQPKHIGVDPEMRGRGVGEMLEEHLARRFGGG